MKIAISFLLALVANVFAMTIETLDEQLDSKNLTVLRLRINNETENTFQDVSVKYFVKNHPVLDTFDLRGAEISLDSLDESVWALTISLDSLPPGIFPYEAGFCIGIHNADWQPRDKYKDPSYIASSNFVINRRVELNIGGNHLPNANPLVLVSGTKMLINEGDSIPFAWHSVPNAEKYRLSIYSQDSQLIYQKETYERNDAVSLGAGKYLWMVEAKNHTTEYGANEAGALVNYLSIGTFSSVEVQEQLTHGIESVTGHKDSPMLVVGWGEYADLREWDRPHLNRTFLDENEASSCWAIAIKNLNKHYGGNLTLDEIRWYAKTHSLSGFDKINAFGLNDGATGYEFDITTGLKYALDSTKVYDFTKMETLPLTFDGVRNHLTNNQEIYIRMCWNSTTCHAMLIDAYYMTTEGNFVGCVNVDNSGNYGVFFADSLFSTMRSYAIIDAPEFVRNTDPLLGIEKFDNHSSWIEWTDSDGDGITDFDEVYRFGTNPHLANSDSDGVNDKDEIHSYTILEESALNLVGSYKKVDFDLSRMRLIAGIDSEYMSDVDGDGLLDGEDPEPYRYNSNDTLKENELPPNVALYAKERLQVNDGVSCQSDAGYCIYASEGTDSEYGIMMGARASAAYLHARNNVLIRSNPNNTFLVNFYGPDSLGTTRPDGKVTIERHFAYDQWPWVLDIEIPPYDTGDSILVVQRGDSCVLNGNDRFKSLKVESGGTIYLPMGNVYAGNLQLEAGSHVRFVNSSRNTVLYVKDSVIWKSDFGYVTSRNFSYKFPAQNFRLFYSGSRSIFFETNWYGTIIAPNAKIVLGQTAEKNLYGQFYANEIVVHQYANINVVPFNLEQIHLEYVFNSETGGGL